MNFEALKNIIRTEAGLNRIKKVLDNESLAIDEYSFEIAKHYNKKKKGLSGLTKLNSSGMVFVYDLDVSKPFTMSGVQFDIDITFIASDGSVVNTERCKVGRKEPVVPSGPYRYVLETSDIDKSNILNIAKRIVEEIGER